MNINYYSLGNRLLLSRLLAVLLLVMLSVSLEAWEGVAPLIEHTLSLLGWVLIGIGVAGRIWSASYISGRKNTNLVVDGPYSFCRNPLYFFSFIAGLGVMLVTETLLLPLLFSALFATYYLQVMFREEAMLLEIHGARFEAYCSRVPRFWPSLSLFSEPTSYTVASAAKFRRNLTEVIWFVIAGGFIEFLEAMHNSGYLPTLLRIY